MQIEANEQNRQIIKLKNLLNEKWQDKLPTELKSLQKKDLEVNHAQIPGWLKATGESYKDEGTSYALFAIKNPLDALFTNLELLKLLLNKKAAINAYNEGPHEQTILDIQNALMETIKSNWDTPFDTSKENPLSLWTICKYSKWYELYPELEAALSKEEVCAILAEKQKEKDFHIPKVLLTFVTLILKEKNPKLYLPVVLISEGNPTFDGGWVNLVDGTSDLFQELATDYGKNPKEYIHLIHRGDINKKFFVSLPNQVN